MDKQTPPLPTPDRATADAPHGTDRSLAVARTEGGLRVEVHPPGPGDRHSRLVLTGSLTNRSAALAREALQGAAAGSGPWLLVDVDAVSRLDRSGLAVLAAARHHVRGLATDGCLHLTGTSRSPIARALASSGLWKALPLTQDNAVLCASAPPGPPGTRRA